MIPLAEPVNTVLDDGSLFANELFLGRNHPIRK